MPDTTRPIERNGSGPSTEGRTALLLIDVINDLDFPEGSRLLEQALPAADRIVELKRQVKSAGIPVIYVNDNFGLWQSDIRTLVDHCLRTECLGRELALRLHPEPDDYFLVKPRHSGFYGTALEVLLAQLSVTRLAIAGFAGDFCVLFTAVDAYMRHYKLVIPADCVASKDSDNNTRALQLMQSTIQADIRESPKLSWKTREDSSEPTAKTPKTRPRIGNFRDDA